MLPEFTRFGISSEKQPGLTCSNSICVSLFVRLGRLPWLYKHSTLSPFGVCVVEVNVQVCSSEAVGVKYHGGGALSAERRWVVDLKVGIYAVFCFT